MKDDVYNVGHESMNFTKEDVARTVLKHVDYYLHFAEVGTDADKRNYEVSYEKIRAKGFETTIDLDRGDRRTRPGLQPDRVLRTRSPTSEPKRSASLIGASRGRSLPPRPRPMPRFPRLAFRLPRPAWDRLSVKSMIGIVGLVALTFGLATEDQPPGARPPRRARGRPPPSGPMRPPGTRETRITECGVLALAANRTLRPRRRPRSSAESVRRPSCVD